MAVARIGQTPVYREGPRWKAMMSAMAFLIGFVPLAFVSGFLYLASRADTNARQAYVYSCGKINDQGDGTKHLIERIRVNSARALTALEQSPHASPEQIAAARKNLAAIDAFISNAHKDLPPIDCSIYPPRR